MSIVLLNRKNSVLETVDVEHHDFAQPLDIQKTDDEFYADRPLYVLMFRLPLPNPNVP